MRQTFPVTTGNNGEVSTEKTVQTQPLSLNTNIRVELVSVHSSLGWDEFLNSAYGNKPWPALPCRAFFEHSKRWC